jgi:glutamine amidotransferase
MIAIIDYDIGNVTAVANMLQRLGIRCKITSKVDDVEQAEKIILPGNGSFDACVNNLRSSGLVPVLAQKVMEGDTPLLGICVGAQMLGTTSEEGSELGLGWIDMKVLKFPEKANLRVPHMGWNQVQATGNSHYLTRDMEPDSRFYFVHSYFMSPEDPEDVLLSANYGFNFAAGVSKRNISGVQFHPEKSHKFGKQFLSAFAMSS